MRFAKGFALVGILGLLAAAAPAADWPTDPGSPRAVAATGADEVLTDMSSDGYYGVIVGWQASDNTARAQHLDPVATAKWATTTVTTHAPSVQTETAVTADGSRGGYIAWTDTFDAIPGATSIYLQHKTETGTALWGDGVALTMMAISGSPVQFTNGLYTVTGVGTNFLNQVPVGAFIKPDSDVTWYEVAKVTDDVTLDLGQSLAGLLGFTSSSATVTTSQDLTGVVGAGDFILLGAHGIWAEVASLTTTDITLTAAYSGETHTGRAFLRTNYAEVTTSGASASMAFDCYGPKVLGTSAGVFVAYRNRTRGLSARDKRAPLMRLAFVDSEGQIDWRTDIAYMHPDSNISMYPDSTGGVILVWTEPPYTRVDEDLSDPNATWAIRVNANGEGVWGNDPVLLYARGGETATVMPDGTGGLWIAARWSYPDSGVHNAVDGGNYVIVNRLNSSGNMVYSNWLRPFDWDAHEKSRPVTGEAIWQDYNTDQNSPVIVPDGTGGAYVFAKDNRMSELQYAGALNPAPPYAYYRAPYENIFAQRLDSAGKTKWNEDESGYWWENISSTIIYHYYPWMEGYRVWMGEHVKSNMSVHCHPWTGSDPVTGTGLLNNVTCVWSDNSTGTYHIRAAELGQSGGLTYWGNVRNLTGTISIASLNVSGAGTAFCSEVKQGDQVRINSDGRWYTVNTVVDDDTLTLTTSNTTVWITLTGQLTFTAGSAAVTGDATTQFTAEVSVGDLIRLDSVGAQFTVVSITDDQNLTVNRNVAFGEAGTGSGSVTSPLTGAGSVLEAYAVSVATNTANKPASGRKMLTVSDRRFGVYVAWTQSTASLDVYMMHLNYWQMYITGRVKAVGPGPDIFPPDAVSNFTATPGVGEVFLTWTNPMDGPKPLKDFAGVMIRRSTQRYPVSYQDGDFIYAGPDEICIDTNVQANVEYFYSIFSWDTELTAPNYSARRTDSALVDFSDVDSFAAQGVDGAVELSWVEPNSTRYAGVVILKSATAYPTYANLVTIQSGGSVAGVTKVPAVGGEEYFAMGSTSRADTNVVNGTLYYYTAFSFDGDLLTTTPDDEGTDVRNWSNGTRASAVPNVPIQTFAADAQDASVQLDWTYPGGLIQGVLISYWASDETNPETGLPRAAAPTEYTEGHAVGTFDLATVTVLHSSLTNGVTYYYAAFAQYNGPVYAKPVTASATPKPEPITGLALNGSPGDRVVPLQWDNNAYLKRVVVVRSLTSGLPTFNLANPANPVPSKGVVVYNVDYESPSRPAGNPVTLDDDEATAASGTYAPAYTPVENLKTYYYSAFNVSTAGGTAYASDGAGPVQAMPADTVPPGDIALVVDSFGDREVTLSWTDPLDTDFLAGGQIVLIRRTTSADPNVTWTAGVLAYSGTRLAVDIGDQTYHDTGLVNDTTYYYWIYSLDDDGNLSTTPGQANATPADTKRPDPVTGLTATASDRRVDISWTNPTDVDLAEIVLLRSTASAPVVTYDAKDVVTNMTGQKLSLSPVTATSYADRSVTNNQTYYYALLAIDDDGRGSTTVQFTATPVDDGPPGAVPNFVVTAQIDETDLAHRIQRLSLTWGIPTDFNDRGGIIIVRRSFTPGEEPPSPYPPYPDPLDADEGTRLTLSGSGLGGTYTDNNVAVGPTYYYSAWAYDDEIPANYSVVATASGHLRPVIMITTDPSTTAGVSTASIAWTTSKFCSATLRWGTTLGYFTGSASSAAGVVALTGAHTMSGLNGGGTPYMWELAVTDIDGSVTKQTGTFNTTAFTSGDDDVDGMPDAWETANGVSDPALDADGDGLTNLEEYRHGTDPNMSDTDGDGLSDKDEVDSNLNPADYSARRALSEEEGCGAGAGAAPLALALLLAAGALPWRRRPE